MRRACVLALLALAGPRLEAGTYSVQTMRSPADGTTISYGQLLPNGYVATRRWPLIVSLHGRGGNLTSNDTPELRAAADSKGYVVVFYDGRPLLGGGGRTSYYVDAPGASGISPAPDESDVLGIVDDAVARLAIDADRVFLAGGSMGGKGAWGIGLRNPHRFAAIAPAMGPTDAFHAHARGNAGLDFVAGAGGTFGTSPAVDAMWFTQSPRFYMENARGVPVLVGHGDRDDVVPNSDTYGVYHHSRHVTDDASFRDERGHTATLSELLASDPEGYAFTTRWSSTAGHQYQVVLPPSIYVDFFEGKRRNPRPTTVVYTAWDAGLRERRAYWLRVRDLGSNAGRPLRVRADADTRANALSVRLTAGATVTVDLASAGLRPSEEVTVRLRLRDGDAGSSEERRRSPAQAGDPGTASLVLTGEVNAPDVLVSLDGKLFPAGFDGSAVTLRDVPVSSRERTIVVTPVRQAGFGLTYPNGTETLEGGSRTLVRFTPTPLDHVTAWRLLLSTDGGTSFQTAAPDISTAYVAFPVRLPCAGAARARFRVEGLSGASVVMADESDGAFTITAGPAGCDTAADADLVLPGAASVPGAGGSRWSTAVTVASLDGPLRLRLELFRAGESSASSSRTSLLDLPASGTATVADVVRQLAPEGGAGAVALRVLAGEPSHLSAGGRTSTPPSGGGAGTYGFYLPAVPARAALAPGTSAVVFGPDPSSRANLGLFALEDSRIDVQLLDASGQVLGATDVELTAGAWTQLSNVTAATATASVLRLVPASGRVHAYVTAVSNTPTNDPQGFRPLTTPRTSLLLPSLVSSPGASGAYFRSDLYLHNPGAETITVTLRYTPRESTAPPVASQRVLSPGSTLTLPDALAALFPASVPGAGSLELWGSGPFHAASVAYDDGAAGRAGQEFPAMDPSSEALTSGAVGTVAGLREDAGYRSNLVLLNLDGTPVDVALRAAGLDGQPLGPEVTVSVPAASSLQLNRVLSGFTQQPVPGARLTIVPRGRILASVALIDNVTNDPTSLPVSISP